MLRHGAAALPAASPDPAGLMWKVAADSGEAAAASMAATTARRGARTVKAPVGIPVLSTSRRPPSRPPAITMCRRLEARGTVVHASRPDPCAGLPGHEAGRQ